MAFHGCPLRCRYCLNAQCLLPDGISRTITPEQLLDECMLDDLYFQATGGGITFGGGEPLLRSLFIEAFARIAPPAWHITVETSLNVAHHHLERVQPYISQYIVYGSIAANTVLINATTLGNLQWMAANGMADKVHIRLPEIPDYNTIADIDKSQKTLEAMGFHDFERFTYIKDVDAYKRASR